MTCTVYCSSQAGFSIYAKTGKNIIDEVQCILQIVANFHRYCTANQGGVHEGDDILKTREEHLVYI